MNYFKKLLLFLIQFFFCILSHASENQMINSQTNEGKTPLHLIIELYRSGKGNTIECIKIIKLYIKYKARMDIPDNEGKTAYNLAEELAAQGDEQIKKLLINSQAPEI